MRTSTIHKLNFCCIRIEHKYIYLYLHYDSFAERVQIKDELKEVNIIENKYNFVR